MILHKVSQSPFSQQSLLQCLANLSPQDGVILTQNAVYAVKHPGALEVIENADNPVYLLTEDAKARNIENHIPRITEISYEEFVALTLKFSKVHSW